MTKTSLLFPALTITAILAMGCSGASPEDLESGESEVRVCASGPTVSGVDVSEHNERVDWNAVKASGRVFAFARVSDGGRHMDSQFSANWSGIAKAGLLRGVYQYFRPTQDAATQADIVVSKVGKLGPGDLPAVLDAESADGQSSATIVAKMKIWLDRVEKGTGKRPIIYTAQGFWDDLSGTSAFAAYPLWVANYKAPCPAMPSTWKKWTIWQYSESGSVPGISGGTDVNTFNGTLAQLKELANGGAVAQDDKAPIEVYWSRRADDAYDLRALASANVVSVEYRVDGHVIGQSTRAEGSNFPSSYRFTDEGAARKFEVRGKDANGKYVALGEGLIDVTADTAVYIRQMGDALYEIGLERAPSGVASIEVRADGFTLTDGVSNTKRSTRKAVRSTFSQMGQREFTVTTFDASGAERGKLKRVFTLR